MKGFMFDWVPRTGKLTRISLQNLNVVRRVSPLMNSFFRTGLWMTWILTLQRLALKGIGNW
jgi:hypothetical protein